MTRAIGIVMRSLTLLTMVALLTLLPPSATAAPGDLLIVDSAAFGAPGTFFGGVIRVDPQTGQRTTVSDGSDPAQGTLLVDPTGITLDADGDILLADLNAFGGFGGVVRVDPRTGQRTTVTDGGDLALGPDLQNPAALALAANGDILVSDLDAFGGAGGVFRVNPLTGQRTVVSDGDDGSLGPRFLSPWGILTDARGDVLVADLDAYAHLGGGVIRVDPAGGQRETVTNGLPTFPRLSSPTGIAIQPDGNVLIAEQDSFLNSSGGVIRADVETGKRTTVSDGSNGALGPRLQSPTAIALDRQGEILLADFNAFADLSGGVIRVDPQTGVRTTVSSNAAPAGGPAFLDPFGIAIEPSPAGPPAPPPPAADRTPPETAKGKGPKRRSSRRRASFQFTSEPGARFECAIDRGAFAACQSPARVSGLRPGRHVFEARAIDAAGHVDPTPATFRFRVLKRESK